MTETLSTKEVLDTLWAEIAMVCFGIGFGLYGDVSLEIGESISGALGLAVDNAYARAGLKEDEEEAHEAAHGSDSRPQ